MWKCLVENFPKYNQQSIYEDRTYDLMFNQKPSINTKSLPSIMDMLRKNGIVR